MKRTFALAALFAFTPAVEAQVTYCKDIGGNKTYCTGGTIIHRNGGTTIIQNPVPAPAHPSATLPNPLLQNNALPTMNAPYSGAGTQGTLPALPTPAMPSDMPSTQAAPVIVVPPAGSRVCHQFGTTLVCN